MIYFLGSLSFRQRAVYRYAVAALCRIKTLCKSIWAYYSRKLVRDCNCGSVTAGAITTLMNPRRDRAAIQKKRLPL
jgi:hypothetical protein